MHELDNQIASVVRVIQLAIAPVFLLTGINSLLMVLANRLGRIVDRARQQEARLPDADPALLTRLQTELGTLSMRARMVNRAITLAVAGALLVCIVIVALFIGALLEWNLAVPVSLLFVASMAALIVSLIYFLREIFVATRTLQIELVPRL